MISLPYYFYRVRRNGRLSRQAIRSHSLEMLQRTVDHAYSNVPFYREKWDEEGFHPDQLQDFEDLRRIPVTTKEELREEWSEFLSRDHFPARDSRYTSFTTYGTTGKPVKVMKTRESTFYNWAVEQRAFRSYGASPLATSAGFKSHEEITRAGEGFANRLLNTALKEYRIPSGAPWSAKKERLELLDPTFLLVKPSILSCMVYDPPEISPDVIVTEGEVADTPTRERASETFGCPVLDAYGSKEFGILAWECPREEHYHVPTDHVVLEALDGDGQPVTSGTGEAVGTTLSSPALPLIRYRLGDVIEVDEETSCVSSPFPAVSGIEGKKERRLGGSLYSREVKDELMAVNGIRRFRVRGTGGKHTLMLDVAEGYDGERVGEEAAGKLEKLVAGTVRVETGNLPFHASYKQALPLQV